MGKKIKTGKKEEKMTGNPTSGGELKDLRQKILIARDLHPKATPIEIADLILNGSNAPSCSRDTLIRQVRRTLASEGEDGRKNNGSKRTVRTP
eukprot:599247-Karenia_brevis.AAC.1